MQSRSKSAGNRSSARGRLRAAKRRNRPYLVENLEARRLLALTIGNLPAQDISADGATIGVEVIDTGGADPTITIYWGDEDAGTDVRVWDHTENLGIRSAGPHRTQLDNLRAGTDYFYRAFAFSFGGTAWTDQTARFTTSALPLATVSLQPIQVVGDSSVVVRGLIDAGNTLQTAALYFGPNDGGSDPLAWEQSLSLDAQEGDFSTLISGLLPDTPYFVRLAATNDGGIAWSEAQTWQTVKIAPLRISEIMAANASTLPTRIRLRADDSYAGPRNSYDWLEIQNATDQAIDFGGYFLSDSQREPAKWQVPATTMIPAHGSIVIFASSKDVTDPALDEQGYLHTNFSLNSGGEYVSLSAPNGTPVHEILNDGTQHEPDISYGFFGNEFGPLAMPSPAAANAPLAPAIGQPVHVFANPGEPASPLIVTVSIQTPSIDLAAVALKYRVMYEDEQFVSMTDDGTAADAVEGDGIFSGVIPGGIAQPGEMIRYYVQTTDEQGGDARMPRFLADDNSPEYFGTMIADPSIDSPLPVLHRFIEDPRRAETGGGTRASVFFDGEFYDNIFIRIRGGTARAWPKKSYKIEFNDDYHFRFRADLPRVDEFNLNTTYTDKSYVRAVLAYRLYEDSGGYGPITFPLRVEQNGEFYSVAHFVEQPDRDFLRRNGLDPDGALYKSRADRLNGLTGRAEGFFEKKTRYAEDASDLQALIDGLRATDTELETFLFDNIDLPAQVNLMAVNLILQNIDATDKNYYIYRDSLGNREWKMLPWDLDLVLGPNALNTDTIVTSEENPPAHTSHPYLGTLKYPFHGRKNHLFDAIVNSPRTNEMFLRRVRTLMDEFLASADTPVEARYFERRLDELAAVLDADVLLDKERWGNTTHFSGRTYTLVEAIDRIKDEYLAPRRTHLFGTHSIDQLMGSEVTVLVPEFSEGVTYFVPTDDSLGTTWTGLETPTNADRWQAGQFGIGFEETPDDYKDLVKTQVNPSDSCQTCTSVFVRLPFALVNPESIEELTLRIKYDDGFIAYINGVEVARRNTRDDNPGFDSRARSHRDAEAVEFENIRISEFIPSVSLGTNNVLAIHAMNSSSTSNDMVISPELIQGVIPDSNAVGIPHQQADTPALVFASYDQNPASGNQDQEYVEIRNPTDDAADISGWSLRGGIRHMFRGGTVIPAGESLFVTPDAFAFRSRTSGPGGGMGIFIQDGYDGHLSSFGETVDLVSLAGEIVDRLTTESDPSAVQQFLRVTEIHYNPRGSDDTEFIELQNISSGDNATMLDLSGVTISDGPRLPFVFPAGLTIGPGEHRLVVNNAPAFQTLYPNVDPSLIVGEFEGSLANDGERIKLDDALGSTVVQIDYDDSELWPARADGVGASLELIEPARVARTEMSKPYRWRGSSAFGGTPGQINSEAIGVVINEVLSHPDKIAGQSNSIELLNRSPAPIDLSGWLVSDSADDFSKFTIPNDTILPPGEFVVFDEQDFRAQPGPDNLVLDGNRETSIWLVAPDVGGATPTFVDDVHFSATAVGESFGRVPDSGRFAPLANPTFGQANSAARVGPVVLSEIHYNPATPSASALGLDPSVNRSNLEFVEIHNPTTAPISLNAWRLRGDVDYDFSADTVLAAGDTLIVVSFDVSRVENASRLAAFRAHHGIDENVRIVGGYSGQLNDDGARLQLQRPGDPPVENPALIPRLWEDEIVYDDLPPWPRADGNGRSLNRTSVIAFGDAATSWQALPPSPGTFPSTSGDLNDDGVVDVQDVDLLSAGIRAGDLQLDLNNDNQIGQSDLDLMIHAILGTHFGDANLDGRFDTRDLVQVFQTGEYEDGIAGNSTWGDGDWDGDGEFGTSDLVVAFKDGGYSTAARWSETRSNALTSLFVDSVFRLKHDFLGDAASHEFAALDDDELFGDRKATIAILDGD